MMVRSCHLSCIASCRAGVGLIQIPRFDVQHLLDRGELIEVMPTHRAASMPVSLLYPHRRQRSRRPVAFVEWFSGLMAPHLESTASSGDRSIADHVVQPQDP
jgi:DNA-binding transcriptional LysR family regulator